MTLPLLIRDRLTNWVVVVFGFASTMILYQFTNRMHFFEPQYLHFDFVDKFMPFWPWTIWIYFTEYIIFVFAFFSLKSAELRTRYFYAYMTILLVSVATFVLFPVTYPRADFPTYSANLNERAVEFMRIYMDSPANCLPSLHVSTSLISALPFLRESRWKSIFFITWASAISISTMTTKQHYFIDVWTSALLTVACYWFFSYKVKLSGSVK